MSAPKSQFKTIRLNSEKTRLEIKKEWKKLFQTKFDDKNKGEGISTEKYPILYVEQGQILYASRNCVQLDFNEIFKTNLGKNYAENITPIPEVGGWKKFMKEYLPGKNDHQKERPKIKVDLRQQQRKNGRGWLNNNRIYKKIKENEEKN